jgi:hypothetical protein
MTSRADKMPIDNSRSAYMKEYRKGKWLEEDNCNNVPKQTKLNAEQQHECRGNKTPQAGNSCAEYMRECRNRMLLEEDNCNNVPK